MMGIRFFLLLFIYIYIYFFFFFFLHNLQPVLLNCKSQLINTLFAVVSP